MMVRGVTEAIWLKEKINQSHFLWERGAKPLSSRAWGMLPALLWAVGFYPSP